MDIIDIFLAGLIENKESSLILVGFFITYLGFFITFLVAYLWVRWSCNPRLARLETDVTEIKGDVKTMKGQISTMDSKIVTMDSKIVVMEGDITTMKGDITEIKHKIVVMDITIVAMSGDIKAIDAKFDLLLLHILPAPTKVIPQAESSVVLTGYTETLSRTGKDIKDTDD